MKIFLLGHKGFIGGHLMSKLLMEGHTVKTDSILHWGESFDVVINLAAKTHIRNEYDPKLVESNIVLMHKVFQRSERIIYASSCSARHFTNPYAMSKMWAETLGIEHGNSLGLRFFNVYGPRNGKGIVWWLMQQPDGAKITVRGPDVIRDYIFIDDVIEFIVKAALPWDKEEFRFQMYGNRKIKVKNNGIADVGTMIGTATMDVVNLYQKLSGKTFNISVQEPGDNEPPAMVSGRPVPNCLTLEEGLLKMINQ